MKTFKIYHPFIDDILNQSEDSHERIIFTTEWDVLNDDHAKQLAVALINMHKNNWDGDTSEMDRKLASIQSPDMLLTYNTDNENHHERQHLEDNGWQYEHFSDVAYLDREQKHTIISISGSSWYDYLHADDNPYYHQWHWLYERNDNNDYNLIDFQEDMTRAARNPMIYECCFYEGVNDTINSIHKMANKVKELFPDNDYYIVCDCKNGHSGALLAQALNAKGCFISAGITDFSSKYLFNEIKHDDEFISFDYINDVKFGMFMKSLRYSPQLNDNELTVYDIAKNNPNIQFQFTCHEDDDEFYKFNDYLNKPELPNVNRSEIKTRYQVHNHYILPELKKNKHISKFFNSIRYS